MNFDNITTDTDIDWNFLISWDKPQTEVSLIKSVMAANENEITNVLWTLNNIEYTNTEDLPKRLNVGEHTVKLKIQDNQGLWSNEVSQTFSVISNLNIDNKTFSLSEKHSMVIDEDGNLYSWGQNDFGQLGIGNTTNQSTPQKIELPNGIKPKSIYSGTSHSMAIVEDNNLYAWGYNNYKQLGISGIGNTNQLTPKLVTLPIGVIPKSLSLGFYHSMMITEDNEVYVWGDNRKGELGLGDVLARYTPIKLTLPNGKKVK